MTKEIKKHYHFLDLPYSANADEIKSRQKAMIKVLRAQAIFKGKENNQKIIKVQRAGEELLNYIENNGVLKNGTIFETGFNSIVTQLFVMLIMGIIAIVGFVSLL